MFALFRRRSLVSYHVKYQHFTVKGCATIYSHSQRECVEQIKQHELKISGKMPEQIIILARSPY